MHHFCESYCIWCHKFVWCWYGEVKIEFIILSFSYVCNYFCSLQQGNLKSTIPSSVKDPMKQERQGYLSCIITLFLDVTVKVWGKKLITFESGGLQAKLSLVSTGVNTVLPPSSSMHFPLLLVCWECFCLCSPKETIKQKREVDVEEGHIFSWCWALCSLATVKMQEWTHTLTYQITITQTIQDCSNPCILYKVSFLRKSCWNDIGIKRKYVFSKKCWMILVLS